MNKGRLIVIATLTLLMLILLTFDVGARLHEDGSIRITLCIPYTMCSLPYNEAEALPIPAPDYGEVTLPTDHY